MPLGVQLSRVDGRTGLTLGSNRVRALDGVRAIAISLVVFNHASATLSLSHLATILALYVGNGDLGVEAFFVLSGYLITTLLLREVRESDMIDLRRFYRHRAIRILPAYGVWLAAIGTLSYFRVVHIDPKNLLSTALFVKNYIPVANTWWTSNSWTLSIEQIFYVFFPALLLRFGTRKILIPLLFLIVADPLLRVLELRMHTDPYAIAFQAHTRLDTIAYGCVFAIVRGERRIRNWFARPSANVVAACALFVVCVIVPSLDVKTPVVFKFLLGYSIDALGVVVLLAYVLERPSGTPARILASRPLVWLGTISYSLYLWQQLFMTSLNGLPLYGKIAGAVGAACLSYYLVERPMLSLGRRRFEPRIETTRLRPVSDDA